MDVKIYKNEITALAKGLENIHKEYKKHLGNRNPFAEFKIGAGFYVWTLPGSEWKRLSEASSDEESRVVNLICQLKDEVKSISDNKTASTLFTVPSNEFIYYNFDKDEPNLLMAAWGFEWPTRGRRKTGDIIPDTPKSIPISVAFSFDFERLPAFTFYLKNPIGKWMEFHTDDSGLYKFASVKLGMELTLKDSLKGKEHPLKVNANDSVYEFDITEYTNVKFKVLENSEAKTGEEIHFSIKGKEYEGATDSDGVANFSIPLHKGEKLIAEARGTAKELILSEDSNEIVFEFEDIKEELKEPKEAFLKVKATENAEPLTGEKVKISVGEESFEAFTSPEGYANFTGHLHEGMQISVAVRDAIKTQILSEGTNEMSFEFEKNKILEPKMTKVTVKILEDSKPVSGEKVKISVEDKELEGSTEEDGCVTFNMAFKEYQPIKAYARDASKGILLSEDSNEIVFEFEKGKEPSIRFINIRVLKTNGQPMSNATLRFKQEGMQDYTVKLPQEAAIQIDQSTFKLDRQILINITDGNRELGPIRLDLEEGEYDYELQEKETEQGKAFPWKQLLALIGLIVFFGLLWLVLFAVIMSL